MKKKIFVLLLSLSVICVANSGLSAKPSLVNLENGSFNPIPTFKHKDTIKKLKKDYPTLAPKLDELDRVCSEVEPWTCAVALGHVGYAAGLTIYECSGDYDPEYCAAMIEWLGQVVDWAITICAS